MLYPFLFQPIFKERVWGGRKLELLYRKPLPSGVPIGESWEVSDRDGDVSTIANGPLAGKDLRWLMTHHPSELLGSAQAAKGRFPLLIKILDAREKLSLQVHPPASLAAQLGGEPKTEMWYVVDAAPDSELFVGLKRGVTRADFEGKIHSGAVAECFHRIVVRVGDTMFLPSGRVHALGSGLVIFEIQQNSDTTYRVYDWNRVGLDGKPRELHIAQSLASIDFDDVEPALVATAFAGDARLQCRSLARNALFTVDAYQAAPGAVLPLKPGTMHLIGVVAGALHVASEDMSLPVAAGQFCLIPAAVGPTQVQAGDQASYLVARAGLQPS